MTFESDSDIDASKATHPWKSTIWTTSNASIRKFSLANRIPPELFPSLHVEKIVCDEFSHQYMATAYALVAIFLNTVPVIKCS
jgi:hypothetical protein